MTPTMKSFLLELADLMEKHGIEDMDATEECSSYQGCTTTGIEFYIEHKYDTETLETTQEQDSVDIGRYNSPETIREYANDV